MGKKITQLFPASRAGPTRLLLSSNEEPWISQKNSPFKWQASYKQASELHVPVAYQVSSIRAILGGVVVQGSFGELWHFSTAFVTNFKALQSFPTQ